MTMPSTGPGPRPAEGHDPGPGTPVNPADAAATTREIAAQMEAAETYARASALAGYAGDGPIPNRGMLTMTGSDDAAGQTDLGGRP